MNKEEVGGEGADLEILDTFLDKLSEKLAKIKVLDAQILEQLTEDAEITGEILSQDDKNLDIEITLKKLKRF